MGVSNRGETTYKRTVKCDQTMKCIQLGWCCEGQRCCPSRSQPVEKSGEAGTGVTKIDALSSTEKKSMESMEKIAIFNVHI